MNNLLLRQKIVACKGVPNLPKQTHRLLRAFDNEDLDHHNLVNIIFDHPAIAARLIALANSVWANPTTPVNSIERACANLGLTVVRSLSIGLALISPFNIAACPAFDIHRFWISSKLVAEGVALLASVLPNKPSPEFVQTLYTGGLLHNLGLICLADLMPKETQQALLYVNSTPDLSVNEALYHLIHTDFCEVGGLLAETWGLPDDLIVIINHHRNTNYQGRYWELSALVGNASVMVSTLSKNQSDLSALNVTDKFGINQSEQQQVFNSLQAKSLKVTKLAGVLF